MKKITFVVDEFALGTPAQQLLDRFLLGYPRHGDFHRLSAECAVCVHLTDLAATNPDLERRSKEHGLLHEANLARSLESADAVIVIGRGTGANPNDALIETVLKNSAQGVCCFVHGALGATRENAARHAALAHSRSIRLLAGTPVSVLWRLPDVSVPPGARVKDALIVVQGPGPDAELDGLEGILPLIERRHGGERGVKAVRFLSGPDLWQAGESGAWSWELLAAALSRSDSPQGDSITDGRTQDLVRLGLVPKLARDPRGWIIEHRDGLRLTLLVLDDVVADYNFALRLTAGSTISAQLYRPPKPQRQEFSRMAAVLEDFFRSGDPPWPISRNILISGLLEAFRTASAHPGAPSWRRRCKPKNGH